MSFGQFGIELQSLAARGLRFVQIVFVAVPIHVKKRAAIRHAGIGAGIVRINHDGAGEHLPRKIKSLAPELVEKLAPSQVIVICLGIFGLLARDRFFFLRRKLDPQRLADAARDFVLHFEHILQLAIVAFRPDGMSRLRANQAAP